MIAGPMRLASLLACLAIAASWLIFATGQARAGSDQSRDGIDGLPAAAATTAPPAHHESSVRHKLDSVDDALLSPFAFVADGSSSEWVRNTVPALLGLLLYGFGLAYAARCVPQRR